MFLKQMWKKLDVFLQPKGPKKKLNSKAFHETLTLQLFWAKFYESFHE